jgi:23S rRNA (cytosine1962-C5)-methyltransferase
MLKNMKSVRQDYELLDSGNERKLERFGPYTLVRPAASAVWTPFLPESTWKAASAWFDRDEGNRWQFRDRLPESWPITIDGIAFNLSITAFGHVGVFPEQRSSWQLMANVLLAARKQRPAISVLNLFAYSGASTIAAARTGAAVCHLDSSKGMVARARENAALNGLQNAPIRWIVEDVTKFLDRECRRNRRYDAIVLDPPSFGRGKSGETYKIERDLMPTLRKCVNLLSDDPLFLLLSCHTPAFTPLVLGNVLTQSMAKLEGVIESGELVLSGKKDVVQLPSGTYAFWTARRHSA